MRRATEWRSGAASRLQPRRGRLVNSFHAKLLLRYRNNIRYITFVAATPCISTVGTYRKRGAHVGPPPMHAPLSRYHKRSNPAARGTPSRHSQHWTTGDMMFGTILVSMTGIALP